MELLGVLLVVLVVIGQFVEGFSLWTYVQFFRGKETTLEKWLVKGKHKRQVK